MSKAHLDSRGSKTQSKPAAVLTQDAERPEEKKRTSEVNAAQSAAMTISRVAKYAVVIDTQH